MSRKHEKIFRVKLSAMCCTVTVTDTKRERSDMKLNAKKRHVKAKRSMTNEGWSKGT